MKLDILAIGVHPDDIELSCCGTLLRHKAMGHRVGMLDLTRGELGTRGSAELRDQEAKASAELLGIDIRENLGMADGFFQHDAESIRRIIPYIRRYQPDIVLANALEDRHPDHGRAARLVAEACFYSGLLKIETRDEDGNLQERWRPRAVYHYIQDVPHMPDFVVDITPFMPQKLQAISAFKSQFYDPDSTEPDSPISGEDFWELIVAKARTFGRYMSVEFAEGFRVGRPPGIDDLTQIR